MVLVKKRREGEAPLALLADTSQCPIQPITRAVVVSPGHGTWTHTSLFSHSAKDYEYRTCM